MLDHPAFDSFIENEVLLGVYDSLTDEQKEKAKACSTHQGFRSAGLRRTRQRGY